ncbi:MAG: RsmB/NOP family class I SAM-dependent RNA methyltransferase, partial [Nitrospirae bacterium]
MNQDIPEHFFIYKDIIADFEFFLEALERPHPSHLRVNVLKCAPEELAGRLNAYGAKLSPLPLPHCFEFSGLEKPGATLEYFLGYYHMQGLSSAIPPFVLELRPGHRVLDMCASPGSKTTQMAALMENKGLIIANELNRKRLGILKFHLERLGVINAVVTNYQAQNFPERTPDGGRLSFDRVLLDAPCSGEGRFRLQMRPDEWDKMQPYSEELSLKMRGYQFQMLTKAYKLLRPGGVLVYSTCTYSPWENEAVVDDFLKTHPEAVLEEIKLPFSLNLAEGVTEWRGYSFSEVIKRCI